jgi:hypothetical protein
MKRTLTIILAVVMGLFLTVSPVLAAKSQSVINISNGFPSGDHFNLNVHGKDPAKFQPDLTVTGGNSIFVSLYGDSTVVLRSDNRSALTELTALDPYAEVFDGTPAKVQLPYESQGYYVFARILGKPNNGSKDVPSSIILTPNTVPVASNYNSTDPGDLLTLGLVTSNGVYKETSAGLQRFNPTATQGKGKSTGVDITGLFVWSGWVVNATLDANLDGVIDINDIPLGDYDLNALTPPNQDYNNDGVINQLDLDAWLTDEAALGMATYYDNEWIFNIADIVEQTQTITNDGTKLLQIRFYPVDTTSFTSEYLTPTPTP